MKEISHNKDDAINTDTPYITVGKCYIIHALWLKAQCMFEAPERIGYYGNTNKTFINYYYFNYRELHFKNIFQPRSSISYFLAETSITTPPTPMTAKPISGDQLR